MIYTNRLMIARSSVKRKTRGFSLPACGFGVTVPKFQLKDEMLREERSMSSTNFDEAKSEFG